MKIMNNKIQNVSISEKLKLKLENVVDMVRYVYYYCQKLCLSFQIQQTCKLHVQVFHINIKQFDSKNKVQICKVCCKSFDLGKLFYLNLHNHIISDKINMKFIWMLNKIEKCLVVPCLVFAQIFQLKVYE
jgi:hypothetical protein